jgi:YVTN family beta-propeller protein
MTHRHRSGTTGATATMTLDRAAPTAAAMAPMVTATIPVGSESDAVAANPLTGSVYVARQLADAVSVISGQTNTVTTTIPVRNLQGVAVSPPTGDVYVSNFTDGTVSVISGRSNTVTATILVGTSPDAVAVNPSTGEVYVTNIKNGTVSVIRGRSNSVSATLPVGNGPVGVAVNPLTGAVYTANIGADTVSVISGQRSGAAGLDRRFAWSARPRNKRFEVLRVANCFGLSVS